jgi:hypothetical protein
MNIEDLDYCLKHLPLHLVEANEKEQLKTLMADKDFLSASIALHGINWVEHPVVKNYLGESLALSAIEHD